MASKPTQAWCIDAGEYAELPNLSAKITFLVRYAVLAPSPWNSQPWKFRIEDSRLFLYEVPERLQEHRDPEGREHYVGCGAALANILIAAEHFGLNADMQLLPSGAPPHCVAILYFSEPRADGTSGKETGSRGSELNERLFQAIPRRH